MNKTYFMAFVSLAASLAFGMMDRDGDGISDLWSGLYPSAGLPSADPDGDQMDNLAESIAGTHPLSGGDYLAAIPHAGTNGELRIHWAGIAGKHYWLQYAAQLSAWTTAPGAWTGSGSNENAVAALWTTHTCAYWRIGVCDADMDGDNLNDWEESRVGARADCADTEEDGMPDGWEVWHNLNPLTHDAAHDIEGDLWDNLAEYEAGTDPAQSNGIAVPPSVPVLDTAVAEVHPQREASYSWSIAGGVFLESDGYYTIKFTATQTGVVFLACTLATGSAPTVVGVYSAQVAVINAPYAPRIIAPGFAVSGQTGLAASVTAQAGATYAWSISDGAFASSANSNSIMFAAGPTTGILLLACTVARDGHTASATAAVHVISAAGPAWEEPLTASSLPPLTLNPAFEGARLWMFANMLRTSEAWIYRESGASALEAQSIARHVRVDTNGWPRELPEGTRMQLAAGYETSPTSYLHGVFVLTWEGQGDIDFSSSRNDGLCEQILLNDSTNGRVVKLIQTPEKYPIVFIYSSNPTNPVRNMRLWAPVYDGAGLELTSASNLAPGQIEGSLEPLPGAPDPMWHPRYLQHLREEPHHIAYRFMGWQQINLMNWGRRPLTWDDRASPAYGFGNLVTIDSSYNRYQVTAYRYRMGLPVEWMIDLCNELGQDLWIQVPHVADESVIRGMAARIAERLDPGLRVWFEFSNEIWNGYGPYIPQLNYARLAAARRFNIALDAVSGDQLAWGSGHLQGLALKVFEDEWRARGMPDSRLINVVSSFALDSGFSAQALAAAGDIQAGLPEVLAITTYFGADTQFEVYALHDFGTEPGVWPESLYEGTRRIVRQNLYDTAPAWGRQAQVASNAGVHLVCYEGGQHMIPMGLGDWNNPGHVDFMQYMYDFQRSRQISELYQEQYALWSAMGGRSGNQFVDCSGYSFWGYWGAKEYVTQTRSNAPKWDAFCAWNDFMDGVRAPSEPSGSRPALPELNLRGETQAAFLHDFTVAGGDGDVAIAIAGGALPPGLSLAQTSNGAARISGVPAADGIFRVVLRALDADKDPDFKIATFSIDPAGSSSNALVVFRGQDIPATIPNNQWIARYDPVRAQTAIRNASNDVIRTFLPFSLDAPIFGAEALEVPGTPNVIASNSPLNMYGGWDLASEYYPDGTPANALNVSSFTGLRDYQWCGWFGDSSGAATTFNALLLWRDIQFNELGGSGNYGFGTNSLSALLQLDLTELPEAGGIIIRFVIRDDNAYYLSEASHNSIQLGDGYFQLADFNNRGDEGKRWATFTPTANAYAMPPTTQLVFAAHAFSNVHAVGVAVHVDNPGWHKALCFSRLIALGSRAE